MLDIATIRGRQQCLKICLLGRQFVEIRIGLAVRGVHLIKPFFGCSNGPQASLNSLSNTLCRIHVGFLRQVAHIEVGHRSGFAFDVLINARHDFQ